MLHFSWNSIRLHTLNFPCVFCWGWMVIPSLDSRVTISMSSVMRSRRGTVVAMMGGGVVVAVLGVVDSGLYGGGMASLYHLVADLQSQRRGQVRSQHTQEEEVHTDMKKQPSVSRYESSLCQVHHYSFQTKR